jgi:tRNA A-37 threonylcarbamoyl transferase component Bud32/streptogramin lyase
MDLTPGQTIGQYRVVEKIGEGGMGAVYKADQPSISRAVVIKVLASSFAEHPEARDRFRRELEMITRLEHPHILPVYDYGEVNGSPYIVMRFMTGGTLHERMHSAGFGRAEAVRLLDQIALALDFAHDRGIIHRDLKPGNILLDEMGNAYLADFGMAKSLSGTQDLTATGAVLGSPAFMSPEQARGDKLDRRSDIYAFAILIYQALSGRLPFEADSAWDYITKHLTEEPVPIRRHAPDLPPAVEAVVGAGMAKDPTARPERATELMASLKAALASTPVESDTMWEPAAPGLAPAPVTTRKGTIFPAGAPAPVALPRRAAPAWRLPALLAAGAAVLLIGGAIVAVVLYLGSRTLLGDQITSYAVGDQPRALLYDGDALWVANFFDNSLTKLSVSACGTSSGECGKTLGTFPVDDLPVALAFDGESVWAASSLQRTLARVDPASGEVLTRHSLPHVPTSLLWADSSLWSVSAIAGTVTKISPDGGDLKDIQVGEGALGLAFDGTSVWVICQEAQSLVQLDPESAEVVGSYKLEDGPLALAYAEESLWISMGDSGEAAQIDPKSPDAVLRQVDLDSPPAALLSDGGQLWAVSPDAGELFRIDLDEAKVAETISVDGYPIALTLTPCGSGCSDLWTANQSLDSVSRIRIQ